MGFCHSRSLEDTIQQIYKRMYRILEQHGEGSVKQRGSEAREREEIKRRGKEREKRVEETASYTAMESRWPTKSPLTLRRRESEGLTSQTAAPHNCCQLREPTTRLNPSG